MLNQFALSATLVSYKDCKDFIILIFQLDPDDEDSLWTIIYNNSISQYDFSIIINTIVGVKGYISNNLKGNMLCIAEKITFGGGVIL
jgi:hypothetical protein